MKNKDKHITVDLISPLLSASGKGFLVILGVGFLGLLFLGSLAVALARVLLYLLALILLGGGIVLFVLVWKASRNDLLLLKTYLKLCPYPCLPHIRVESIDSQGNAEVLNAVGKTLSKKLCANLSVLAHRKENLLSEPDSDTASELERLVRAEMAVQNVLNLIVKQCPSYVV